MLMARWHLLHCVDVDVDVCSGIWGVQHLAERQNKAACGVLEQTLNKQASVIFERGVSFAEARALPLRGGQEEAQGSDNLIYFFRIAPNHY